jgi:hypothetical protein
VAAVRIDQPDEAGSGAADSGDVGRVRAVPAASAGEHAAYRARVDAVFRAHAIDQAYDRVREVKDAIRYTFCYLEDLYAEGVHADCGRLESAGFERVDRRNLWDGLEYKGVNSRWRVPESGQLFKVQFHTQASLDAKEETHGAYEQIRSLPDDDAEVGKLHTYQREVTAKVPIPPGALGIPDYS